MTSSLLHFFQIKKRWNETKRRAVNLTWTSQPQPASNHTNQLQCGSKACRVETIFPLVNVSVLVAGYRCCRDTTSAVLLFYSASRWSKVITKEWHAIFLSKNGKSNALRMETLTFTAWKPAGESSGTCVTWNIYTVNREMTSVYSWNKLVFIIIILRKIVTLLFDLKYFEEWRLQEKCGYTGTYIKVEP